MLLQILFSPWDRLTPCTNKTFLSLKYLQIEFALTSVEVLLFPAGIDPYSYGLLRSHRNFQARMETLVEAVIPEQLKLRHPCSVL